MTCPCPHTFIPSLSIRISYRSGDILLALTECSVNIDTVGWRDDLEGKSTFCSRKGPESHSSTYMGCAMPSSDFHGHQAHVWYALGAHIYIQASHSYIKIKHRYKSVMATFIYNLTSGLSWASYSAKFQLLFMAPSSLKASVLNPKETILRRLSQRCRSLHTTGSSAQADQNHRFLILKIKWSVPMESFRNSQTSLCYFTSQTFTICPALSFIF